MSKPTTHRRGTSNKPAATRRARTEGEPVARKTPARKPTKRTARKNAAEQPAAEDGAAFVEALIESGQAARLDREGKLPAGATHKICEDEAGNVTVVRRRFSIT